MHSSHSRPHHQLMQTMHTLASSYTHWLCLHPRSRCCYRQICSLFYWLCRDVQANQAQQDAEVYALVTAWFGSIEPPPGPGDSFEDLARTAEGKQVGRRLPTYELASWETLWLCK